MQQIKEELSPTQLQQFMLLYPGRKKSVGIGILLALFLGMLGIHWFYLGNTTRGVVYLVLGTLGWVVILPPIVIAVMCIVDAFGMGSTVAKVNSSQAMSLKEELKLLEA